MEEGDVVLCCTGHTCERTCRPAGVFSLPQSRERCSGSPPESPQDLVNTHRSSHELSFSAEPFLKLQKPVQSF